MTTDCQCFRLPTGNLCSFCAVNLLESKNELVRQGWDCHERLKNVRVFLTKVYGLLWGYGCGCVGANRHALDNGGPWLCYECEERLRSIPKEEWNEHIGAPFVPTNRTAQPAAA